MATGHCMDVNHWPENIFDVWMNPFWQIITSWALMTLVLRLGKFGTAFRVYNTFFHEAGHALMSLLTSGSVVRIELFSNAAGVAVTSNKTWMSKFLVSLAGYPAGAAAGWALLTQIEKLNEQYQMYIMLGIFTLVLMLWVRNLYGAIWILVNLLLLITASWFNYYYLFSIYFFIIGSFVMIESIWSCLIIIYVSAEDPTGAGDAKNLRDLTYIPAVFWALLLSFISVWFLKLTLENVIDWKILM